MGGDSLLMWDTAGISATSCQQQAELQAMDWYRGKPENV